MRRIFNCLAAALFICVLALVFSTPYTVRTVKASDPQEKCDHCMQVVVAQFEQCQAVHGESYQRCYDDYNEGVVHCFAHFCEQ
jgi:hypothetical protein